MLSDTSVQHFGCWALANVGWGQANVQKFAREEGAIEAMQVRSVQLMKLRRLDRRLVLCTHLSFFHDVKVPRMPFLPKGVGYSSYRSGAAVGSLHAQQKQRTCQNSRSNRLMPCVPFLLSRLPFEDFRVIKPWSRKLDLHRVLYLG